MWTATANLRFGEHAISFFLDRTQRHRRISISMVFFPRSRWSSGIRVIASVRSDADTTCSAALTAGATQTPHGIDLIATARAQRHSL